MPLFHARLILLLSKYFRWKFLGAVAWRLPLRATLLLWPKTITMFWFSILSMCLNAQLQLSRPKYLRARLLKRWWNFCIPKKTHIFWFPYYQKISSNCTAKEVTPPPPSTVEKKILKRFKRKVERNDDITYTQKNQIFLTRKITVRCSIKKKRKKKEIICDVLLS